MSSSDRRIDWPGLMRAGLHQLRLRPDEFWALTPLELMVMLGRESAAPGFSRGTLESLMTRFPDDNRELEPGTRNDRA